MSEKKAAPKASRQTGRDGDNFYPQSNPESPISQQIIQAIEGKTGNVRVACPACNGEQKKTLSVDADNGVYQCFRCGLKGTLKAEKPQTERLSTPDFLWSQAEPATDHPYLKSKGVKNHGLRTDRHGNLVVPLSANGHITSLQFIPNDAGRKNLLSKEKGGKKKGSSFRIGQGNGNTVYIAEGYATAASIYEATGETVTMAVDAGNLKPVAENLRKKYPDANFIFCADNDRHKPESDPSHDIGYRKAIEAARAVNGRVCIPEKAGQDFNDLYLEQGPEAVKKATENATGEDNLPAGITGRDLLKTVFPEPRWAVKGIMPEGVNILGGKPKQGKSLKALNIALSIVLGGKALGTIPVDQGAVIYLALEDTQRRLKSRIQQMTQYDDGQLDDLLLFTEWPRMGEGGLNALDKKISQVENLRLVIIDTLALFKPAAKGGNANVYAEDYDHVSRIKKVADKHGISILLIHHLRKMASDDVFDTFSGTLGLTGAADGLLALTKRSSHSVLHITGRDVEPAEMALEFDPKLLSWRLLGDAGEVQSTENKQKVFDALKNADGPLSPKDLAELTGLKNHYIRNKVLPFLVRDGGVMKKGKGIYTYIGTTGTTGTTGDDGDNGDNQQAGGNCTPPRKEGDNLGDNEKPFDDGDSRLLVPIVPVVPDAPSENEDDWTEVEI